MDTVIYFLEDAIKNLDIEFETDLYPAYEEWLQSFEESNDVEYPSLISMWKEAYQYPELDGYIKHLAKAIIEAYFAKVKLNLVPETPES